MIFGKKNTNSSTTAGLPHGSASGSAPGQAYQNSENTRILSILAQDYLKEKKSKRRWSLFFKLLVLAYVGVMAAFYFKTGSTTISQKHTAIVELNGQIGPDENSAYKINKSLANAFEAENSVGVILQINSPGGTPVQAAQVNEEILRLKSLYPDKPFYVAITDICASGGYYIAVAADQIFAHPASIVGSIGVLMNGFGFVESLKKLGVERRLITAGENKGILDPFSPVDPQQVSHAETMLAEVHNQFINAVKSGRGDKLKNDPDIFSGLFWSGERAMELGLIDQFGSAEMIARDVIGEEDIFDYTFRPRFIDAFAKQIGASIINTLTGKSLQIQ